MFPAPTPSFDCKENPITFTTPFNDEIETTNPFSNWQSSFPVRMVIAVSEPTPITPPQSRRSDSGNSDSGNSDSSNSFSSSSSHSYSQRYSHSHSDSDDNANNDNNNNPEDLIGRIKLFWTETVDDIPTGYILCDGSSIPYQYQDLDQVLSQNPDYNQALPNCLDRVIIGYSDDFPFGSVGGNNQLPEFEIEHDHDIVIQHDQGQCDFRMFYISSLFIILTMHIIQF